MRKKQTFRARSVYLLTSLIQENLMNVVYVVLIALAALILGAAIFHWWNNRFNYYIINVIINNKKFKKFVVVGVYENGGRTIIKTDDGPYMMSCCRQTFKLSVQAANLKKVCFRDRGYAYRVIKNLLKKK